MDGLVLLTRGLHDCFLLVTCLFVGAEDLYLLDHCEDPVLVRVL